MLVATFCLLVLGPSEVLPHTLLWKRLVVVLDLPIFPPLSFQLSLSPPTSALLRKSYVISWSHKSQTTEGILIYSMLESNFQTWFDCACGVECLC